MQSLQESNRGVHNFRLVALTDAPEHRRKEVVARYPDFQFDFFPAKYVSWPEATLLRYEAYQPISHEVSSGADFVAHIDADMLVNGRLSNSLFRKLRNREVAFALHPGWYRPKNPISRAIYYLRASERRVSDRRVVEENGGLGHWEISKKSRAFVPLNRRADYVCGGFWIAKANFFPQLVENLAQRIQIDLENNVIARWHDESHVNAWCSENPAKRKILGPQYCFSRGNSNLFGKKNVIEAVRKGKNRVR